MVAPLQEEVPSLALLGSVHLRRFLEGFVELISKLYYSCCLRIIRTTLLLKIDDNNDGISTNFSIRPKIGTIASSTQTNYYQQEMSVFLTAICMVYTIYILSHDKTANTIQKVWFSLSFLWSY